MSTHMKEKSSASVRRTPAACHRCGTNSCRAQQPQHSPELGTQTASLQVLASWHECFAKRGMHGGGQPPQACLTRAGDRHTPRKAAPAC